jgi:Na+/melibiose symporter-like transporter
LNTGSTEPKLLMPKGEPKGVVDDPPSGQHDYVKRVLIFLLLAALTAIVVWTLIYAATGLLVIFAGVLGAIFLTHVSSYLARHSSLSYRLALALTIGLLVLATGGTLYFLGARIAERPETLAWEVRESRTGSYVSAPTPGMGPTASGAERSGRGGADES